jgi:hypothetical protein
MRSVAPTTAIARGRSKASIAVRALGFAPPPSDALTDRHQ